MHTNALKMCAECDLIFPTELQLTEHMETIHTIARLEIILVKMRKLAWPAMVTKREGDIIEVRMLADDSIKVISEDDAETFNADKIGNTRNTGLKKAFAKALELLGKEK